MLDGKIKVKIALYEKKSLDIGDVFLRIIEIVCKLKFKIKQNIIICIFILKV